MMSDGHGHLMRTTLMIDDDVLAAVKGLAKRERRSLGEVIFALAPTTLTPPGVGGRFRSGVPLLPKSEGRKRVNLATPGPVRRWHDELP
jgi:hypothetical protein